MQSGFPWGVYLDETCRRDIRELTPEESEFNMKDAYTRNHQEKTDGKTEAEHIQELQKQWQISGDKR